MSRIQKYKILRGKVISPEIICDFKNKEVKAIECQSCEHFVSVHPDREEIICNAEIV